MYLPETFFQNDAFLNMWSKSEGKKRLLKYENVCLVNLPKTVKYEIQRLKKIK